MLVKSGVFSVLLVRSRFESKVVVQSRSESKGLGQLSMSSILMVRSQATEGNAIKSVYSILFE